MLWGRRAWSLTGSSSPSRSGNLCPMPWPGPRVIAPAPWAGWRVAAFTVVCLFCCPRSKGAGRGFLPCASSLASFPPLPVFSSSSFLQARMNFWEGGTQVLWTDLTLKTQEPQNNERVK